MKKNPLKQTEPEKDLSVSMPGFCIPTPVWLAQPAPPFEYFEIHTPHFYMIHGTPMAFAREVSK